MTTTASAHACLTRGVARERARTRATASVARRARVRIDREPLARGVGALTRVDDGMCARTRRGHDDRCASFRPSTSASRLSGRAWRMRTTREVASGETSTPDVASSTTAATSTDGATSSHSGSGDVKKSNVDRGLGQRRALSAETRSRPFVPLKGEVLHIAWLREYDETGKFTREEGLAYRACIERLMAHYTMEVEAVEETLDGIERGWSDVTLSLGGGFNLRMQRHTEFETLTLSGPGNMKADIGQQITPWEWLLPQDWLIEIPGKVFLVNHAVFRQTAKAYKTDEPTIKELNAARRALSSCSTIDDGGDDDEDDEEEEIHEFDAGSLVGCGIGDGSRMYVNYELDDQGVMQTLVVIPPGENTFIRAGRQLQRFFALEQYRLLILQRLPTAKSKYPLLAGLNERYETLSRELRRSKATSRGHKDQQEFVTQITDLEQAITQLVTRSKLVALTAASYMEIINLRLAEASFTRLGYEIRFLPLFVKKRIDPAISTINAVAEQALILSDALERTTSLVQASVEVRLQRINERIATYGLFFTLASLAVSFTTSIQPNGSLHWFYVWFVAKTTAIVKTLTMFVTGSA